MCDEGMGFMEYNHVIIGMGQIEQTMGNLQ